MTGKQAKKLRKSSKKVLLTTVFIRNKNRVFEKQSISKKSEGIGS